MDLPTIIDDMQGLYSHTSEAFRAGERHGRDDFFRAVHGALSRVSVEQEKELGDIATRGFHVAEQCCKVLSELKLKFDTQRKTL